jgi:hypothetical protein
VLPGAPLTGGVPDDPIEPTTALPTVPPIDGPQAAPAPTPGPSSSPLDLPVTGAELLQLVAAAALLVVLGAALRAATPEQRR